MADKRPCFVVADLQSPLPFDGLLEALLSASDCDSSHVSLALQHILLRHPSNSDRLRFVERSLTLASQLQDVGHQLRRECASVHNSVVWPLTHDLTIKVFSLLGMHSICQAAISCSLFHKVAMESACYREVDLTGRSSKVNNRTVAQIIERAGQHLRSLRLGSPTCHKNAQTASPKIFPRNSLGESQMVDADKPVLLKHCSIDPQLYGQRLFSLSKSCLEPLIAKNGAVGAMLETLHLFDILEMDSKNLCRVIAACTSLTDLELVGLCINARVVMNTLALHCHGLKRLCFQMPKSVAKCWRPCGIIKTATCIRVVQGCPNISSLALRGFRLPDQKVKVLLKGLHHLMEVDFSEADLLTGSFMRDLTGSGQQQLQSLILRDCVQLREVEVERLLFCLSTGECKSLRYLDVSNKDGLAALESMNRRLSISVTAVSCIRKDRPDLELIADFPDERSSSDCESSLMISSFCESDDTGPSSPTSVSIFEDALSASSAGGNSIEESDSSASSTNGSSDGSDSSDEDEDNE